MMLVQALHIPFDLFFLLKSVIFGSPQFGPLLKLLLLLWGVVGVAVSLPMVFIMSLFLGPVIAFGWPLSLGIRIMLESIGFALVDGVKYKAEQLRAYEREGPYMRLKLLHAILAFVFMFVGMAVCGVGFLLKTIVDAPAFVFSSLAEVWKDTCVGIAPSKERGPPGPFDDLPCCALMNCVGATSTAQVPQP
ncbi:hypothetical protein PTSG_04725 [Salpingoeca rosetta]|uniref:Uncharacterized protein n=1 Tax=Salpingoeca rosetta (strain ATCC 50818 / BSB-021) TaxID=946362 RepID=F2U9I9_SALR5|nr:uncharacterized protein PTSG_04725 [Salpingoeca rosetta]EGD73016.1 hypothetical protein PTSG_04725 [Salpingoeca rosetta]|eukprot:XP_004994047.1 hypothetical protein PTSG_04725 [Salpingoeca rosetta]